jgi:hypothetical protein
VGQLKMPEMLQKRHGTAFITYLIRHVLTQELPASSGLGSGNSVRQQVATRLTVAFSLHLQVQPITARALLEAGCGSINKNHATLSYLTDIGVLRRTQELAAHGSGRVHHYHFTDEFTGKIMKLHNGIGLDEG